jgi:hypothetical protein
MRSLRLLLKKMTILLCKVALVAAPAIVSSFYWYRAGVQDTTRRYSALTEVVDNLTVLVGRQGHIIERMRGEVNVFALLESARVGAGYPTFPLPEQQHDTETVWTKRLTTPK